MSTEEQIVQPAWLSQMNRVAQRIGDLLEEESGKSDYLSVSFLGGQLLALCGCLRTAPENSPAEIQRLAAAAEACLKQIIVHRAGSETAECKRIVH